MTEDKPTDDNWEWETPEQRQPRGLDREIDLEQDDVGFPMVWILIGGLAGLLTLGLIALGVAQIVKKSAAPEEPPPIETTVIATQPTYTPTMVSLVDDASADNPTVAAEATLPPTVPPNTPTPVPPTETPVPAPPTDIQVGGSVQIINTGGSGLNLRAGPGVNNEVLVTAAADAVVPVVGGPQPDEDGTTDDAGAVYLWWQLRYTDGTEGWGRGDFLSPTLAP